MSSRMTVLASGSAGNCTLLESPHGNVLIDLGLSSRQLSQRVTNTASLWSALRGVLLTHIHCDHWKETALSKLVHYGIPLYCHEEHRDFLRRGSRSFQKLDSAGLVCLYQERETIVLSKEIRCQPWPVSHDSGATSAFRLEFSAWGDHPAQVIAYAADLGTWSAELVSAFQNADVLAVEFNHDVGLQRASGRPPFLIDRVLGDAGHLSNEQGAELLAAILANSEPGRLRHIVQLHLSRQCNRAQLAQRAARTRLHGVAHPPQIHTATQDYPTVIRESPRKSQSH